MTQNSSEDIGDSGEPNESYNSYSVDDEDQPQSGGDSLVDDRGLTEPLDEGYSPPEKWSVAEGYGNTPLEEELGETLDMRLAQEEPEPDPYEVAANETEGPSWDRRMAIHRSGSRSSHWWLSSTHGTTSRVSRSRSGW